MSYWKTRDARERVKYALAEVREEVENCREKSIAVTKLEEAMMWLRAVEERQHEAELDEDE